MFKKILLAILLIVGLNFYAQKINFPEWSKFSKYERELTVYEKDSAAHAVVLSEVGYIHVRDGGDYELIKESYVRIKILDKEGYSEATVEIPTYKKSRIVDIKASTTNFSNGKKTTYINKSDIYKTQTSENWSLTSFTLPAIEVGSIIEYSYKEKTPYRFNFADGWIFQNDIPTIKSTFYAKIPGFWQYHISTISILGIEPTEHKLIDNCMYAGGAVASCLFIKYVITDIPAFIEEDFMTSKYNFLKQIRFELKSFTDVDGVKTIFSKKWKDVDKEVFTDYDIGRRYGKTRRIKEIIPEDIYTEKDLLTKAKKVFSFIQNYYNWNGKHQLFKDFSLKNSIESKVGNMVQINSSLINTLKAVGIDADITLLSTRDNGIPIKLHPVISDFNYMVAHINIKGNDYLLDAADRNVPFGVLPFKCLNGEVRVFNKADGSYWLDIQQIEKSEETTYMIADILENSEISLKSRVVYKGYKAIDKRKKIKEKTLETYKNNFEEEHSDYTVINHSVNNLNNKDKPLIELLELTTLPDLVSGNTIYFNPFIVKSFDKNPFNLKERYFPVNMGYKNSFNYHFVFSIPDNYQVKNLPKNRKIILPDNAASFTYLVNSSANKIKVVFKLSFNKTKYESTEYGYLRELISQLIVAQNEMIILTKN